MDIEYKIEENGCWRCTSHGNYTNGYVSIGAGGRGKSIRLHRYMYMKHNGLIEEGNLIRHICDNKWCINPEHLIQGTGADNMNDKVVRNRQTKGSSVAISKLTEEQVREIKSDTFSSAVELANLYKVSVPTIYYVKSARGWKHVTI